MRKRLHRTVPVLLVAVAGMLTGCSAEADGDPAAGERPAAAASGKGQAELVKKGGTVGKPGTRCALPVTFDLAVDWSAEAVPDDPELAPLARKGTVRMACEIDAKPAGHLGFLRVWTGQPTDSTPRQVLEAFMADERNVRKTEYTKITAGDFEAVEVGYTVYSPLLEESRRKHALAVTTPEGAVVLHLGGLDTEEHEAMLPAYRLAQHTLSST